MEMRRILALVTLGLVGAALSLSASAANPAGAKLLIRHQVKGCHTWSLNGAAFQAAQTVKLKPGGSVLITNNDMMPHFLIKLSGAVVTEKLVKVGNATMGKLQAPYDTGVMPHLGSILKVTFPTAGIYTFRTKTGADFMMLKTVGKDNRLTLKVIVG
jgi:plastocyanin